MLPFSFLKVWIFLFFLFFFSSSHFYLIPKVFTWNQSERNWSRANRIIKLLIGTLLPNPRSDFLSTFFKHSWSVFKKKEEIALLRFRENCPRDWVFLLEIRRILFFSSSHFESIMVFLTTAGFFRFSLTF